MTTSTWYYSTAFLKKTAPLQPKDRPKCTQCTNELVTATVCADAVITKIE